MSTWLNAGVPPTQVAEWAGHSVNVLLRVYAKCVYGQDEVAKARIEAALALTAVAERTQPNFPAHTGHNRTPLRICGSTGNSGRADG